MMSGDRKSINIGDSVITVRPFRQVHLGNSVYITMLVPSSIEDNHYCPAESVQLFLSPKETTQLIEALTEAQNAS